MAASRVCSCVQGIEVLERIPIPPEMIPLDAHVEIDAKVAVGYHGGAVFNKLDTEGLKQTKGRDYGEWRGAAVSSGGV